VRQLEKARNSAQTQYDNRVKEQREFDGMVAAALSAKEAADKKYEGARKAALLELGREQVASGATAERLEKWIHTIYRAPAHAFVDENGLRSQAKANSTAERGFEYDGALEEGSYSIVERLRVLGDLRDGRPPYRDPMDPDTIRTLRSDLKLGVFLDDKVDKPGIQRREAAAGNINRMYWAFTGLMLFVPLLVLGSKFMMDEDTARYFQRSFQRRIGYPGLPADDPGSDAAGAVPCPR
jgi:hypothetical protein